MAQAGRFSIDVSEPSPVWLDLHMDYQIGEMERVLRFRHCDLRDLKHVVDAAVREAAARLGPDEAKRYGLDIST